MERVSRATQHHLQTRRLDCWMNSLNSRTRMVTQNRSHRSCMCKRRRRYNSIQEYVDALLRPSNVVVLLIVLPYRAYGGQRQDAEKYLNLLISPSTHKSAFAALRMEERKEGSQSGDDQTGVGRRDHIHSAPIFLSMQ